MRIKYYEASSDEVAERLREALSALPEIQLAFLFGSVTRRSIVRDVDVMVYFKSEPDLRDIIRLSNLLEDSVGIPVDVVPLRYAPPKLRLKAMLEGVRLLVRDERLLYGLMTCALSEAGDVEIKLRSLSISR